MRTISLLLLVVVSRSALGTDYFVSPSGSDSNTGTSTGAAWKTLQHAADVVGPGAVVTVLPGNYKGFNLTTSGTALQRITFRAEPNATLPLEPNPAVVIDQNNSWTNQDRINLEGASYVVVEGFTVIGTGNPATNRACIRSVTAEFVTVRRNRCDLGGKWGIFTGFVDDLLIENNIASNSADEHGIYVSNSGDRPTIRGNRIFGNHSNGIHMNGDLSQGGDGIISQGLVEKNVIYENGNGNPVFGPPGGSAINCDGVRSTWIRNNLLYANHKSGISLYQIDGAGPSKNNFVVCNTIHNAADARWAINIQDGSTDNTVRDNVIFNDHPTRGAIDISANSLPGFVSDYNVVKDKFSIDGTFISFAQWKTQTGQDAHSTVSTPAATFAAFPADYDLKPGSPALNTGTLTSAPGDDLLSKPRPFGAGIDRGCYEHGSCIGSFAHVGQPLPGVGGAAPTLVATGCPDVADSFSLAITATVPSAPGVLFAGTTAAQLPFLGGTLYVIPQIALNLAGSATLPIAVPPVPALAGLAFRMQAAFADPAALFGVALSDALVLVVG